MKKVVIFSSKGGGGHTAVANALQHYLKDSYHIKTANIFTEVLAPLDLLQILTRGCISGESIYNFCIARKWYRFLNLYYHMGIFYYENLRPKTDNLIDIYLNKEKPDFIVSVVPLVNNIILSCAQKKNIPFLLIPTDIDITTFIANIDSPNYKQFKIAIPFQDEPTKQKLLQAKIPAHAYQTTGFVLRSHFFEEKEPAAIKFFYDAPQDKPIVLLLLGAVGSQAVITFAQQLSYIDVPCHILICIGRQEHLKNKINAIDFPPHISFSIIEFTDRISDLMAIADVLITKSGSVSVNEAIYMNLPMILDATTNILKWERYNHVFIKDHEFGISIENFSNLSLIVTDMLTHNSQLIKYRNNLRHFNKKQGGQEIKKIIGQMLNEEWIIGKVSEIGLPSIFMK